MQLRMRIFHFFFIYSLSFSYSQLLIRGPYLQQSTPHSVIIHWRTADSCDSKVAYGFSVGNFPFSIIDTLKSTEHIIRIDSLQPSSKYYYNIGTINQFFYSSANGQFFYTHPLPDETSHYRFWVTGDAGWGSNNQRMVRDGFLYFNNDEKIDGWIWLGDNAYYSGLESEYQNNVFSNNTFENIMKNLVVWAAPGNHDYGQNPANVNPAWLDIFDYPANGESGGLPSGTEKYFSWDYGNIHFIQLDSYGSDRSVNGPMLTWLRNDLLLNKKTWTIAYWHHPPYTKGNHDSDNLYGWDPELPEIRSNIVPVLEEFGVDLVLSGHSHAYERSYLIDGHYGASYTLQESMKVDTSSGSYPAQCAYRKDTTGGKGHKGTIYTVAGTGGVTSAVQASWPHPIMYRYTNSELGSLLLEIHENKLQAFFVNAFAQKKDSFTIIKNMTRKTIQVCKDSAVTLFPRWHEKAFWDPTSFFSDSLVIAAQSDSLIIARDVYNCLTDTFELVLIPDSICLNTSIQDPMTNENSSWSVYPNPSSGEELIFFRTDKKNEMLQKELTINILNASGFLIKTFPTSLDQENRLVVGMEGFSAGLYLIEIRNKKSVFRMKIIRQ